MPVAQTLLDSSEVTNALAYFCKKKVFKHWLQKGFLVRNDPLEWVECFGNYDTTATTFQLFFPLTMATKLFLHVIYTF